MKRRVAKSLRIRPLKLNMRLVMRNFRCYSGTVEFKFISAFTRILGPSGSGKSTIIDALIFAISGKMRNCSSLNNEKAKYEVELFLDHYHIHRKRTTVLFSDGDITVCDAKAQSHINQIFGEVLLCFSQNLSSFFLEKSPREQLEVLETVVFKSETSVKDIKTRFKENKARLVKESATIDSKIALVKEFIQKMGPVRDIVSVDDSDETSLRRTLVFHRNRLHLEKRSLERQSELSQRLHHLQSRLTDIIALNSVKIDYTFEELYAHINAKRELTELQYKNYSEYTADECRTAIMEYKSDLSVLAEKTFTSCPKCYSQLVIRDSELRIDDEDDGDSAQLVQDILLDLDVSSSQEGIEIIKRQVLLFDTYLSNRVKIERISKNIIESVQDEKKLLDILNGAEQRKREIQLLETEIGAIKVRLDALRAQLIELDISSDEKTLVDSISQKLTNKSIFEQQVKDNNNRKEYSTKLFELERAHTLLSRKISSIARAFSLFLETEHEYMKDKMEKICSFVNQNLVAFFPDYPPHITLSIDASSNGVKSLNVGISYMDHSYSYSMLSSGEQVKVNMAFLLAFAKIQNYKILLLDEATRHLDKTNTNRLIKYISQSFDGKIVSAEHTEEFEEHKTLTLVEYVER